MFEEIDWCKDDKRYTAFDGRNIDKDSIRKLNSMCIQYRDKIIELEDYIDKNRLREYEILKKNENFYFTVDGSLNGSSDSVPYTLTKGLCNYDQ